VAQSMFSHGTNRNQLGAVLDAMRSFGCAAVEKAQAETRTEIQALVDRATSERTALDTDVDKLRERFEQ
jgi:hypothetical protein